MVSPKKDEKWHPLELGLLKFNVDATICNVTDVVGVGAKIRYSSRFVMGVMVEWYLVSLSRTSRSAWQPVEVWFLPKRVAYEMP